MNTESATLREDHGLGARGMSEVPEKIVDWFGTATSHHIVTLAE